MSHKILLVIENRHERETIRHALSPSGYTVIESESSGSALAAIANHPDIEMTILDWDIDQDSDSSTFNILNENFPSIPIFVVGSDRTNATIISAINMGAIDYIFKPVNKEHLIFMVDNILSPEKGAMRNKASRKQVLFQASSEIELIAISKQYVEFKLNFSIPRDTVTVFTCNDLSEALEISFKTRFSCRVSSCEKDLDYETNTNYYKIRADFISLSPLVASKIEMALKKNLFASKEVLGKKFIP